MINNNIISLEQTEVEFFPKITDVVIPKTIGGVTVKKIGEHYDSTTENYAGAFEGKGSVNVVIPRRVTYVSNAFDENASYRYYDELCASDVPS